MGNWECHAAKSSTKGASQIITNVTVRCPMLYWGLGLELGVGSWELGVGSWELRVGVGVGSCELGVEGWGLGFGGWGSYFLPKIFHTTLPQM